MTCYEVQNWMLTEESPQRPTSEVRAHVRLCAVCRGSYNVLCRILLEVESAPPPPIPFAAREKLLASLPPRGEEANGFTRKTPAPPSENGHQPSPNGAGESAPPRRSFLLFRAPAAAVHSLKKGMSNARPWVRWTAAAAAALLCVLLGMGIQALLTQKHPIDQPVQLARGNGTETEQSHEGLEEATLKVHIDIAQEMMRGKQLGNLVELAAAIRKETFKSAQEKKANDLALLTWLSGRVLQDGIQKILREEGGGMTQEARDAARAFLDETAAAVAGLTAKNPSEVVGNPLRQLGRQVREVKAFCFDGGPEPPPLPLQPPAEGNVLLQVMVIRTVELAQQTDPIARADASVWVADALAKRLEQADGKEAQRLTASLDKVVQDAVCVNLSQPITFEGPPVPAFQQRQEERKRRLASLTERLGKTGDRLQAQVLGRVPPECHNHLKGTIELAHKFRKEPPGRSGQKPSWHRQGYKDKSRR